MVLSPNAKRAITRAGHHQLATAILKIAEFPEFSKGITRLALVREGGVEVEVEVSIRPANLPRPTQLICGPAIGYP